jgi:hypothetical protein
VLAIQWNNFRALLPIGIDADSVGAKFDPVDVLLLADSGYAASNPKEWIVSLNPQLIVLSVAAGDPDGLPSPDTLDAAGGHSLLRTDRNGWITVTTDGSKMQVEVERKEIATPMPTSDALQVEPKETETAMPSPGPGSGPGPNP